MTVQHLTVNSGSLVPFETGPLHRGRVAKCRRIWPGGGALPPPWQEMRVDFGEMPGAASFAIYRADVPMLLNVVCWSPRHSEAAFGEIIENYHGLSESSPEIMTALGTAAHVEAPGTPWLATLMLPSILAAYPPAGLQEKLSTIAQLEQCMAAALIPAGRE